MNLTTMYSRVMDIKFNPGKVDELIADLEYEIAKESAKVYKREDRLAAAFSVLRTPKTRPILQKAYMRNGRQLFTDSYVGFALADELIIPELPMNNPEVTYPDLERAMPLETLVNECELNVEQAFKDIRIKKIKSKKLGGERENLIEICPETYVDPKLLEKFLRIMNVKPGETIKLKYRNQVSAVALVKGRSTAVILPVRIR